MPRGARATILSPMRTARLLLAGPSFTVTWPASQAFCASVRDLKIRAAHNHWSRRTSFIVSRTPITARLSQDAYSSVFSRPSGIGIQPSTCWRCIAPDLVFGLIRAPSGQVFLFGSGSARLGDRLAGVGLRTIPGWQMNYFGHVALASAISSSPEFLFGSMLPDLSAIVGCPTPQCALASVRLGVAFHLASDDEFHGTRVFRSRVSAICQHLQSAGMRRAPARAVSHVGFELLLDAELGKVPVHGMAFRAALHIAGPTGVAAHLCWSRTEATQRFEALRLRLIERSTCRDFFSRDRLIERLDFALRSRPRLCMVEPERQILREWLYNHSVPSSEEYCSLWMDLRERVAKRWQVSGRGTAATAS